MALGQGRFAWIAVGIAWAACLSSPAAALDPCQADKYEGQRASSANTLFITEFHISNAPPVGLCPQQGAYFKHEPHQVHGRALPVYFWFRLQGDRSLVDALTARGISSLRLKAVFQQKIFETSYASLDGAADTITLRESLPLTMVRSEAMENERRCSYRGGTHGLFDWRGNFEKRSGFSQPGGFRVKIAVDRQDDIQIACGLSIGCQADASRPAWIAFIR
jgi:hypothetical protein